MILFNIWKLPARLPHVHLKRKTADWIIRDSKYFAFPKRQNLFPHYGVIWGGVFKYIYIYISLAGFLFCPELHMTKASGILHKTRAGGRGEEPAGHLANRAPPPPRPAFSNCRAN